MIKFEPGDHYCCWNGILITPENHLSLFGVEEEIYEGEGWIDADGILYSDLPIGELLIELGIVKGDKVTLDIDFLKNLVIKSYSEFTKDHPGFNRELYEQFYEELDNYYKNKEYLEDEETKDNS
ncbi:MAG: hypothetical protein J6I84_04130 [Bacilli bacterium]|nr:hypothetical protein [Bacilli bacterium]